eukprot:g3965.t1
MDAHRCQLHVWYEELRARERISLTFPTEFIELTREIARDLFRGDGIDFHISQRHRCNSFNSGWSSDSGGWQEEPGAFGDVNENDGGHSTSTSTSAASNRDAGSESSEEEVIGGSVDEHESSRATVAPGDGDSAPAPAPVGGNDASLAEHNHCENPARPLHRDDDAQSDSDGGSSASRLQPFAERYPAIHADMKRKIDVLGGDVVPKLHWTLPRDAKWIAWGKTLSCSEPEEVVQLLRASDFVEHDLDKLLNRGDSTGPIFLALRKTESEWNPAMEFRCFVKDGRLFAMTQRELTALHDFLLDDSTRARIARRVRSWYEEEVKQIVQEAFDAASLSFDVYVKLPGAQTVWEEARCTLIDLAPFPGNAEVEENSSSSFVDVDLGLFRDAEELAEVAAAAAAESSDVVDLRVCRGEAELRPDAARYNTMPLDLWDFASQPEKMLDAIRKIERAQ